MDFTWKQLQFKLTDGILYLKRFEDISLPNDEPGSYTAEIHIEGEHKLSHYGTKLICSSEAKRLKYHSHECDESRLTVVMRSELVEARVIFDSYPDTTALRIHTEVTNISSGEIVLEDVSSFVITGFGGRACSFEEIFFTRFTQSHHLECQPKQASLFDWGLHTEASATQKKVSFSNVGSWSTKEELPQGILEDRKNGKFLMFQIESNNSWYYEIGDCNKYLYLYLGGANLTNCGWSKRLKPGECYITSNVALSMGGSLNFVIGEMTKYRRHIAGTCASDRDLPSIYNEYMHFSWDSPSAEATRLAAPTVAEMGVDYYVIDCGWHDEVPGNIIYSYVGKWNESHTRFPLGIKETLDYIRSLGLKPGLWIEPEIIGQKCADMLSYYGSDCFLCRNGKPIRVFNRLFLDFRAPKVIEYMNGTIRRMVEEYGAEYIKFDYNQDLGIGVDSDSGSFSEGLEKSSAAFLKWADGLKEMFPHVIFEACASGGMRMDYSTLSHFSLLSSSDQIKYRRYPYIAGNILSALLPEQAAVWSYPVNSRTSEDESTPDCIAINMVNSFLGRIHLASRIFRLDRQRLELIREGIAYHKKIAEAKKRALPYFPLGFTDFRQDRVAAGFTADGRLYLAVWYLNGSPDFSLEIPEGITDVKLAYPSESDTGITFDSKNIFLSFKREEGAVFLEIDLK